MTVTNLFPTRFPGLAAFALAAILLGGLSQDAFIFSAPTASEQTKKDEVEGPRLRQGRRYFEKMLEALGGRERLDNIRDSKLSVEYKVVPGDLNMMAVYYAKLPDKLRMDSTVVGTMIFDGDKGWRINARDGSVRDLSQKELADFKDSAWATQGMLNPEMQDVNPVLEGRVQLEGKDYIVISYKDWGGYDVVYVLIDPATFFPYKLINIKSGSRTEVFHSDYRDIDGLKLPFSFNVNIDGKKAIQMDVREWKFNSNLDDSLFSKKSAKKEGFHIDLSGFNEATGDLVIIHKVEPIYPELAKRARVSGQVVLRITIDEAGLVQEVGVIDGHAMLTGAAVEAVRQWRYRPTVKDGNAVPVTTLVTVNFEM
jgi:TonB family protein